MLSSLRFLLFLIVAVAFSAFAVVNRSAVEVSLFPLPYSLEMPVFLLTIFSFALGVVIAGVLLGARAARSRRLYHGERKRVMALQNELEGVKAEKDATGLAHY